VFERATEGSEWCSFGGYDEDGGEGWHVVCVVVLLVFVCLRRRSDIYIYIWNDSRSKGGI